MPLALVFFSTIILSVLIGCGREPAPSEREMNEDEIYLARIYAKIVTARNAYYSEPSCAESLFAAIDSTIDSLRIANTITALDREPDRWLLVYREIERLLQERVPER